MGCCSSRPRTALPQASEHPPFPTNLLPSPIQPSQYFSTEGDLRNLSGVVKENGQRPINIPYPQGSVNRINELMKVHSEFEEGEIADDIVISPLEYPNSAKHLVFEREIERLEA